MLPWLPTVLNILADVPQCCPVVKDLIMECFGRPGGQGSAINAFNPLAAQGYVLCRQGSHPQSLRQWQGRLNCLQQRSISNVDKNGQVCVLERVCQTMPYLPLNYLIF